MSVRSVIMTYLGARVSRVPVLGSGAIRAAQWTLACAKVLVQCHRGDYILMTLVVATDGLGHHE